MIELVCKITGPVGNNETVHNAIQEACSKSKVTILKKIDHKFEPQGYTALFLLAESHASVHTWPELGYALVDYFSCATDPCISTFIQELEKAGFKVEDKQLIKR